MNVGCKVAVGWLAVSIVAGLFVVRIIAVGDQYRDLEGSGPL